MIANGYIRDVSGDKVIVVLCDKPSEFAFDRSMFRKGDRPLIEVGLLVEVSEACLEEVVLSRELPLGAALILRMAKRALP